MSGLFQDDSPAEDPPPPPPDGPGLFGDALPAQTPPPEPAPAYRVLARKYRPTTFGDLIGQEAMVRILRNAFALNRVAHAFMLTGVRGVGKTTTARIIARALNCVGPDGTGGPSADPCGVCPNCVAILADRHPDVMEMDAASRTGVDDVREIIEATRYRPIQARAKVFVIDEVHMLTRNAFNALLKTLEEPPGHVKFVFATTEIRKVPITVLSRCQRFDLRRVRVAELTQHFTRVAEKEGVTIEPAAVEHIARAADGSVRDGLSMLDQAIAQAEGPITAAQVAEMLGLADREAVFELLEAVMAGKPAAALAVTDRAYERGADLGVILQDLLELVHTLTRLKSVPALRDSHDLPEAERTRGTVLADQLSLPVLARAWQLLLKGAAEVETAPDRRAAAEMVLIRLCHVSDLPPPGELVRRLSGPRAEDRAEKKANAPPAPVDASHETAPGSGEQGARISAVAEHAPPNRAPQGEGEQVVRMLSSTPGGAASAAVAVQDSALSPAPPRFTNFREVTAFVASQRQAMLHAHLLHSVHLVRFAPPVIELRPQPEAPRDLASKLAALLTDATGTRWTIALSTAEGEQTLASQGNAADAARRASAADHPLVRAIMQAFPGARIDSVRDATADAYGLPPEATPALNVDDADIPDFAPLDAEFSEDMEPDS